MKNILVMGARGQTGSQVVKELTRQAGVSVRAVSRRPSAPGEIRFDWSEPETWQPALDGIDGIYMVKPKASEWTDVATTLGDFLNQAKGVRRIVLLSEIGAGERDAGLEERRVEMVLEASSFEWTILRPHWFIQNFADPGYYLGALRDEGEIRVPTAGRAASFVDTRDIADVAVCALLQPGHAQKHYTLTGPAPHTWASVVSAISKAAGRPMRYVDVPLDEFVSQPQFAHLSEAQFSHVVEVYRLLQSEVSSAVSGDFETATGRKPRSIEDFIIEATPLWQKA